MLINNLYLKRSFVSLLTLVALVSSSQIVFAMNSSEESPRLGKGKRPKETAMAVSSQLSKKPHKSDFSMVSSEEDNDSDDGFIFIPKGAKKNNKHDLIEEEKEENGNPISAKKMNDKPLEDYGDFGEEGFCNLFAELALDKMFEDERLLLTHGKIIQPIEEVREQAENGNESAAYELARRYQDGRDGVGEDNLEAYKWFYRAGNYENSRVRFEELQEQIVRFANNGSKKFAYELGVMHFYGRYGLERCLVKAFDYFTKADSYKDSANYLAIYSKDNN